jgi:microcystin-dependent protein
MEVGSIILYSGVGLPSNYLVCDGSEVDRDLYAALFSVIGTTYGPGNGSTTFNLPNLSGRLPMGSSLTYAYATTGGEETHSLLSSELASHSHGIPGHTHESNIIAKTPELSHTVGQPAYNYTTLSGGTNGGGGYSNNVNYYNGRANVNMSRSTNLAVSAHAAAACTVSGGVTDCPAFDTESAGLSTPHNNMMPYLSLTYLIYAPETVYEPGMAFYNGCLPVGPSGCYIVGKG